MRIIFILIVSPRLKKRLFTGALSLLRDLVRYLFNGQKPAGKRNQETARPNRRLANGRINSGLPRVCGQ